MFGTILTFVCTLMHLYVWRRLATLPAVARRVPKSVTVGVGVAVWTVGSIALVAGHGSAGPLAGWLELVGMTWLGTLFLTAFCLLVADLATGFGSLAPRFAPRLRGGALLAGVALSVVALVQGHRPPVVSSSEVRLAGLPAALDGTVLVAVSDLHLGAQLGPEWLAARVAQVQAQRPDLVLLLGDLFEGHGRPQAELLPVLGRLSAPLGVWAVTGNHEHYGRPGSSQGVMEEAGIQVLHDRWVEVRPGLVLAGVDGFGHERQDGARAETVARALAGRPAGATLFLSHSPAPAATAASLGAGLMLSGHTHGGQIWPFDLLVRLTEPLVEGRYQVGAMTLLVCRGTGTWGPRMRLWRRSEMLRVVLRAGR